MLQVRGEERIAEEMFYRRQQGLGSSGEELAFCRGEAEPMGADLDPWDMCVEV